MNEQVIVIDFGGQYNQLITRRIRELNVYAELISYKVPFQEILARKPIGIIFTGGPNSVYYDNAPKVDDKLLNSGRPVLGICYGAQLIANMSGGEVSKGSLREYGKVNIKYSDHTLFEGMNPDNVCWMSHTDLITRLPRGFKAVASTKSCPTAAIAEDINRIYGVQFHRGSPHRRGD